MTRAAWIVFRREIFASATSAPTWVVAGAAWLFYGFLFTGILNGAGGDLRDALIVGSGYWMFLQLFLASLWCMRLLSEERRLGTFETLMTAPVGDASVVLGKYASATVLLAATTLVVPLLPFVTAPYGGRPDLGQTLSAYLAFVGSASVFCAVGLFASSLTSSQAGAAFLSLVFNALLAWAPSLVAARFLPDHVLRRALARGSLVEQVLEGASGVIDANNLAFQAVATALFLLFAVRSLESRKWR